MTRGRVRQARTALGLGLACVIVAGCTAGRSFSPAGRQDVIDRIVASSAKIMIEQGGRRVVSGSGVVVASGTEGPALEAVSYVLTAAHVLDGNEGARVVVRFPGAQGVDGKFVATICRRGNPDTLDLALLRISGVTVPPIVFPTEDRVRLGEGILIVGYPWGKRLGLYSGIVSQLPTEDKDDVSAEGGPDPTIVVDAASAKGVSGGGVFREATGTLVGLVEGYQTASIAVKDQSKTYSLKVPMPGETFVVPVVRIRRFLKESGVEGAMGQ